MIIVFVMMRIAFAVNLSGMVLMYNISLYIVRL